MFGRTQSAYVWCVAAVLSLCSVLCADVIIMKDGKRVECKIIAEMDEYVEVQVKRYGISTTHKYPLTQIKSITKGEIAPEPSEGEAPAEKPEQPGKADTSEKAGKSDKSDATRAEPAKKPSGEPAPKEPEAAPAVEDQRPVEFDLRLAMFESLIYDTFEDGPNKIEPPKRRGYFVLLPFHYGFEEGPYVIALRTYTLSVDQGAVRCRGFVPLEARALGTGRPAAGTPKAGEEAADTEDAPVQLSRVKGSPLYERMTVYLDGDQPMVSYVDQSRSTAGPGVPKSPVRTALPEPPRRSGGTTGAPPQAEGERPVRGYEKGRDKEAPKSQPASGQGKGKQGATPVKAPVERAIRDRSIPSDGKPASQWAAMLLEVSNDASVVYVHIGSQKLAIELRLIDVMGQAVTGGAKENTPEELKVLAGVAEYILNEGPALSRLAVHYFARLHEGLKSAQRPQPTPGAQGEGELDKRTRIIERSLLAALVQKDERTGRIAWRAITSGDTLPKATEMAIAELDRPQALKAILREVEKNIKRDAALSSTAVGGPGGGRPSLIPRGGMPGAASLDSLIAPLPDGGGTPATWALLGALMRCADAQVGAEAVTLAMSIASKQAAMALGQPSVVVAGRMMSVLAKAPPSPLKGLALRLAMCGIQASKDKQGIEEALAACAGVAQQTAAAGMPIVVVDPADVLLTTPMALRENPDWQVRALAILQFCRLGIALESAGIDKWLTGMTDKLMAQGVRDASYVLVAEKWEPSYLPPLSSPRSAEAPAGGQPGAPSMAAALGGRGQGGIEKFLVDGMTSASGEARVFIIVSLLRAGRADLVMGQIEKAEPPVLVGLLKVIPKLTAGLPPSIIPGEPSRFVSLSLAMGLLSRQKDVTVTSQVATLLDEMSSSASGDGAWRLGFAFKRAMQWERVVDLSASTDSKVAGKTRTALGRILPLAAGETTALSGLKDRASVMAKLDDYDNQSAAKLPGKYHLMVFCDLMVPSYSLEFDPAADSRAKEREVKIASLRWDRRVIGLEPGVAEIRTAQERKLDVVLGAVPIGTGVAATAKDAKPAQTRPAAAAATPAKPSPVDLVEALKRRQGAPGAPGAAPSAAGAEPPAGTLEIRLPMLVGALLMVPAVKQQFPGLDLSNPSDLVKVFPPLPPKAPGETKESSDPFTISMSHLAFGTRQGSMRFAESSPPTYERLVVNEQNKPIRGQPMPMMKEVQVFLEPVRTGGGK